MKKAIKSVYFKVVVSLIIFYTLLGFVAIPYLIQSNFTKLVKQNLGTNAYLGKVYLNPYTFEIELSNLLINGVKNKPLLFFKELKLDIDPVMIIDGKIVLDAISLDSLKINIDIYKNKKFNFSHILEHLENNAKKTKKLPKENKEQTPLIVEINKLSFKENRFSFSDDTKSNRFILNTKPFHILLTNLTTKGDKNAYLDTYIEFEDLANFDFETKLKLNPLKIDGDTSLKDIRLNKIYSYLSDDLKFKFDGLVKNISTDFHIKIDEKIKGDLKDFNLFIKNAKYSDDKYFAGIKGFGTDIGKIDIEKGDELKIDLFGKMTALNLNFKTNKGKNNFELFTSSDKFSTNFEVNMSEGLTKVDLKESLISLSKTDFSNDTVLVNSKRIDTKIKDINFIQEEQSQFIIRDITLKNSSFDFTDLKKDKNKPFRFKNLSTSIDKFSSDKNISSNLKLSINTPKKGVISIDSVIYQEPFNIKGDLGIKSLTLTPYNDYLKDSINMDIKTLFVDSKLALDIDKDDQKIKGDLLVSKIDLYHSLSKKNLLKLDKLELKKIDYKKNDLFIKDILIDDFQTSFKVAKDKKTNMDNLVIKKDTNETKSEDNTTKKAPEPFNYHIENLTLQNGKVEFSDHSLPLNFDTNIHSLKAKANDISSKNEKTDIKLEGVIEEYGLANIKAQTILANFKDKTDIEVNFENLDVRSFSPYSGKFIGSKISDGRLWLDLNYNISNSNLSSTNRIRLKKMRIGEDVNSSDAMDLPVSLAIALLEDSDELIDVNIPIKGDIDNPQFELGPVIWKAVGNMITNIVTAPFRFLGSLLGIDGDELGEVEFRYGESNILPPQKEKLDKLIDLLLQKKQLIVSINPSYNNIEDGKTLKEKKFKEMIKSKNKEEKIKKLYLSIFGKEKLDKITKKYKKEKILPILSKALKDTITVSLKELDDLAKNRAENIKSYFISKKLDKSRITLKPEIIKQDTNETKSVNLKLELNAKGD